MTIIIIIIIIIISRIIIRRIRIRSRILCRIYVKYVNIVQWTKEPVLIPRKTVNFENFHNHRTANHHSSSHVNFLQYLLPNNRLAKIARDNRPQGVRSRGRPKKRWKESLNATPSP